MAPIEGRIHEDDNETQTIRPGPAGGRELPPPGSMSGYGSARRDGRDFMPRLHHPVETKPFFLTSEFFAPLLLIIAMAISSATNSGFDARLFWILTTAVVAAYMVSRGIAKSGTKSRAPTRLED